MIRICRISHGSEGRKEQRDGKIIRHRKMPAKGENTAKEVQKFMWRLGGECDRIGRRIFGVIERNDFDYTVQI